MGFSPVPSPISYADALDLAAIEHDRFLAVLRAMRADDWGRLTDCDPWTARDVAGHVLGSMHDNSSLRRAVTALRRAQHAAKRHRTIPRDEMTAAQVCAF